MVSCCCGNKSDKNTTYNRNEEAAERHYGCYRIGMLVAFLIILVLLVGTVTVFVSTDNTKIILIVTIITLIIVAIFVFIYFIWQQKRAIKQRESCGWTRDQRQRFNKVPSSSTSNHTSWTFGDGKTQRSSLGSKKEVTSSPPPKYTAV